MSNPSKANQMRILITSLMIATALGGCQRLGQIGKTPNFTPIESSNEFFAMNATPMPEEIEGSTPANQASLWSGSAGLCLVINARPRAVTS